MSYFAKVQLKDQYGFLVECTPMDELRTIEPVRLVGSTFVGTTLDTNFWTATIVASGGTIATAAVGSGKIVLNSKRDATGSVILQSNRKARYIGGSSNRYRAQVQFSDTGLTNNTKRWGLFDGADGAYFKLAGTALSVNTMKATSETSIASASWNGSTTTPTLTNCNTYEIYITNRKIYFTINGVLVHTEDTNTRAGAANDTWAATLNLPAYASNINTADPGADTTMSIRVATIYRLGSISTLPIYKNITAATDTVCKYGAGTLQALSVNSPTAASQTAILYDAITAVAPIIGTFELKNGMGSYSFGPTGIPFNTGLTVRTSAICDITVVYE